MSDEIKVSRPQMKSEGMGETYQPAQKNSSMPWIVLGVVVVVLIVVGVLFRDKLFSKGSMKQGAGNSAMMTKGTYQSVFLTNGQVYFGKISNMDNGYITLSDIYYLQVVQKQPIQGTPSQPGQAAQQQQPQQEISLVKLGNELHGPVDEMHINKDQVLFYEDLKQDGSVVSAILKDKADKAAAPAK
jgi:sRNA-binding regulator protein Hfq